MVFRVTEFQNSNQFLYNNRRSRRDESGALERLSTLKRVNRPSDDAVAYQRIANSKTEMDQARSFIENVESTIPELNVVEDAMENVRAGIVRARELVTQASNGNYGPGSLAAIAIEIDQIRDNIINEMNTKFEGNYLFSGTATATAPFDTTGTVYNGNTDNINIRIDSNETMDISYNGSEVVFGAGGQGSNDDILDTLARISTALNSSPPPAAPNDLETLALNLEPQQNRVQQFITDLGSKNNRLQKELDSLQDFEFNLTDLVSELEDADIAEESVDLTNVQTQIQAQLRSQGTLNRQSLLDFLG